MLFRSEISEIAYLLVVEEKHQSNIAELATRVKMEAIAVAHNLYA